VFNWSISNKVAQIGDNNAVQFANVVDESEDEERTHTANADGAIRRRNGQKVKCIISKGNHWPNKCPELKKVRNGNSEKNSEPVLESTTQEPRK